MNIWDLTFEQLTEWCKKEALPGYRARQIFQWLHKRGIVSWDEMTDLPQSLRQRLAECFSMDLPTISSRWTDKEDGTEKLLIELADGRAIESVLIPHAPGSDEEHTLCVSTQVGCGFACRFCATGRMGLVRDLSAGEIVAQVVLARRLGVNLKRVVLMGMGEPLHNYDNTMAAIRIICDREGMGWSPRRITLSTVGLVPEIYRLGQEAPGVKLAVSLHGTTDQKRSDLTPIAQVYTLDRLFEALRYYHERDKRRISFEYLLIRGVNDGLRDAKRLSELLRGLVCHVNLIPYNRVSNLDYYRPSSPVINRFAEILRDAGIETTIRASRGRSIRGACGQLATDSRR
ncbi:MAG: 23S rRNA (adenine(2503)-C(2))-methyltransferase RlmN [bacterium]